MLGSLLAFPGADDMQTGQCVAITMSATLIWFASNAQPVCMPQQMHWQQCCRMLASIDHQCPAGTYIRDQCHSVIVDARY